MRHMQTPTVQALATPGAPADAALVASAGDPTDAGAQATGAKRTITQMDDDAEGDDEMGQTVHGGASAVSVPTPLTPVAVPRSVSESPATDDNELPTFKKNKDSFVRMIAEGQTLNDPLDYGLLMDMCEIDI